MAVALYEAIGGGGGQFTLLLTPHLKFGVFSSLTRRTRDAPAAAASGESAIRSSADVDVEEINAVMPVSAGGDSSLALSALAIPLGPPPSPAGCLLFYNALKYLPIASAAGLSDRVSAVNGACTIDALAHIDEGDPAAPHAWSIVAAWEEYLDQTANEREAGAYNRPRYEPHQSCFISCYY
jgi:hypothetical protein